jgi:hypothetical protein
MVLFLSGARDTPNADQLGVPGSICQPIATATASGEQVLGSAAKSLRSLRNDGLVDSKRLFAQVLF